MEPIRDIITLLEEKSKPQDIEIIKLNYGEAALSPVMSAGTFRYHWGKLAHAYADRYNKGEGDKQFNYAGATLHNLLFTQFRAPRNNNTPNGPIGNLINSKFKSWNAFKDRFKEEALKLQGSGWIYLARSGDIKTIHNHDMRSDILILVDMWEHAYNMDYGTNKAKYIDSIWRIFDWNMINTRYMMPYK